MLAKCFSSVVLVDCTYKTNRYKMTVFAMVGITSTRKTFSITYCLYIGIGGYYQLALSRLKLLFAPHDLPRLFVTDREFAVINAIKSLFTEAHHMLCTFYISRNVKEKCKLKFKSKTICEKFIQSWTNVTRLTSEAEFFEGWGSLKKD